MPGTRMIRLCLFIAEETKTTQMPINGRMDN